MEYFVGWIACVLIGALIGKYKGRADSGVLWSALLGPIGWIVVALMEDLRPKCPHCRGVIPAGARKCMHCGENLVVASGLTESDWAKITSDWGSPAPQPSPVPSVPPPAPASTIPCPLCGQALRTSSLKTGENYCPHCYQRFVAE
jgi:hypothetical protein